MAINLISYISKAETIYVSSVAPTYEHNLCHDAILSVEQLYAVSIWFFQFTLWSGISDQSLCCLRSSENEKKNAQSSYSSILSSAASQGMAFLSGARKSSIELPQLKIERMLPHL